MRIPALAEVFENQTRIHELLPAMGQQPKRLEEETDEDDRPPPRPRTKPGYWLSVERIQLKRVEMRVA
jgi:hypothetical protein